MNVRRYLLGVSLLLLGIFEACSSSSPSGGERQSCYPSGTCNAGLSCFSNVCVNTSDGGIGGASGSSGGKAGNAQPAADGSAGAGDGAGVGAAGATGGLAGVGGGSSELCPDGGQATAGGSGI